MGLNYASAPLVNNRSMLCLSGVKQNLRLLHRIIEDLNGELHELTTGEIGEPAVIDRQYRVVFATSDVPLHLLESLRALPNAAEAKFVLLTGDSSDSSIGDKLRHAFQFDLFIQRPIKSSRLSIELEQLLAADLSSEIIINTEEAELNFTDSLKGNYISVLDTRVDALHQAVSVLSAGATPKPVAETDRLEAQRLAHNMRGTASSFGLTPLAAAASKLETALGSIAPEPALLSTYLTDIDGEAALLKTRYGTGTAGVKNIFARINVVGLMSLALDDQDQALLDETALNLTTTSDVDEFVKLTESMPTDAVLIDLDCASISGFDVARTLRENEKMVDLPIGFIKGENSRHFVETDCAHAGGSLVLQSPLPLQSIINGCNYLVGINENGRPRILIVDDDPDFTALISATLAAEGMIIKSTTEPLKTEFLLQDFAADLLIIDARMPQQSGIDLCKHLRENPRWRDLPILFLTAEKGVDTRIKAYESGADDYLLKPLIVPELLSRVKGRLERAKFLKERMGKDALTGLLLRRSFLERLDAALNDAVRQQDNCSICLLDIDHFKSINDSYGHGVGDDVLSRLGRTLSRRFRSGDIRGRWGGEEFILAFPHTTSFTMKGAVKRLLDEFQLLEFKSGDELLSKVTFSAGIATFPGHGSNAKQLILCADEQLYRAKHAGRNRVCAAGE